MNIEARESWRTLTANWRGLEKQTESREVVVVANGDQTIIEAANDRRTDRCPVCGGLNPGDITHTRCM